MFNMRLKNPNYTFCKRPATGGVTHSGPCTYNLQPAGISSLEDTHEVKLPHIKPHLLKMSYSTKQET